MRRHVHRRERGFSLVELLVTVVMSGILFGAMTPMFLSGEIKSSSDEMRNIALNLAQDRVEKIHTLEFSQITLANLQSSTFDGNQFGTSWTSTSGGSAKVFTVAYTVQNTAASGSQPAYVSATVTVTWAAPPSPVLPVVLETVITSDFAGPNLTDLTVGPLNGSGYINSSPVTLTATVATADVSSTAQVVFSIYTQTGSLVTQITQTSGSSGVYTGSWNASSATNGVYEFQAQAYTSANAAGNVWQRRTTLQLNSAPAQLSGLTATAGKQLVMLSWTASTASDLACYEVWRGTTSGGETLLTNNLNANGCTDTGLTSGTTYYYEVYAVDTNGNLSPASSEVSAKPTSTSGSVPGTPGSFSATRTNNTAVLSWTASSNSPAYYYVYRDSSTTPYACTSSSTHTYTDTIGYGVAHTYYVVGVNAYGLGSATSTLPVNTATVPTYTMTVTVNQSSPAASVDVVQNGQLPDAALRLGHQVRHQQLVGGLDRPALRYLQGHLYLERPDPVADDRLHGSHDSTLHLLRSRCHDSP